MVKSLLGFILVGALLVPSDIAPGWGRTVETFLRPVSLMTARAALAGIHLLGVGATREDTIIRHPAGFAYEVGYRCTGLTLMSLLAIAMLSAKVSSRRKFVGIVLGLVGVFLLNWIRLLSLFWIGINSPNLFGLAHNLLWQAVMIMFTLGVWWGWRVQAGGLREHVQCPDGT